MILYLKFKFNRNHQIIVIKSPSIIEACPKHKNIKDTIHNKTHCETGSPICILQSINRMVVKRDIAHHVEKSRAAVKVSPPTSQFPTVFSNLSECSPFTYGKFEKNISMIKAKHYSYNILIAIAKPSTRTLHCTIHIHNHKYMYKNARILLYFNGGNIFRINFLCHSIVDDKTCALGPPGSTGAISGRRKMEKNEGEIVHPPNCNAP